MHNQFNLPNQTEIDHQVDYHSSRLYFYIHDALPIGARLTIKSGARINWETNSQNMFFEPRLSATFKATEQIKAHASWGIYNQFVYKIANVDRDNNYTWLWITASKRNRVLGATHWVGGINVHQKSLTINIDGYYKTTRNLIRREFSPLTVGATATQSFMAIQGDARTYGIDTYVKKDFGHHSLWASYTLSKAEENMSPFGQTAATYSLAHHDQRHELKVAALFKAGSFYFTGNYVYGSGMQILRELFNPVTDNISYNRFDVAIIYQLSGKLKGETGVSMINLFDTYNLKYANLKNINIAQNVGSVKIYTGAVPLTPVLFLKMTF